ncbi:MAG: cache domain-containing protein [Bacteroidales bacterium]|nr:cache domain-containing protein [Bacteroidales bacterium]
MEGSPGKRSGWKFILKIDIPAFLAFSLFIGLIFFYLIPGFEETMKARKRVLIQEITSSAYSLLEYYNSLEQQGLIDSTEAKNEALSAISSIRYGEKLKDYLWITDLHPRMIVHPYRPDLNGKDLTQFRDPRGKPVFVEFVKAVSATGESYVDYMWQWNDDSTRIVSKLSYVRLFEPWGWIIGTGIYIDDVTQEIRKMEFRALIISGIIGIVIILLLILISNQSHKTEKRRNLAEEELRKSRELYRTLAEASSEGVILWSSNGMQANKTILSWLDYEEREFISMKPDDIFTGTEIITSNDPDDLYEELTASHYSRCSLKTKKGD